MRRGRNLLNSYLILYYQRGISDGFGKAGTQGSHVTRWLWKHIWLMSGLCSITKGKGIPRRQVGPWVRRSKGGYQKALIWAQLTLPVWCRTGQLLAVCCSRRVTETRQFQYTNRNVHTGNSAVAGHPGDSLISNTALNPQLLCHLHQSERSAPSQTYSERKAKGNSSDSKRTIPERNKFQE